MWRERERDEVASGLPFRSEREGADRVPCEREREMRLPRGCRFDPRERELIEYLVDKVEGRPDACQGVIKDGVDVYGCSPDQFFGASTLDEDERLFCFILLSYRKTGRDRSTPEGYWKSIKGARTINVEGRAVGSVQELRYFHGKKQPERTKWVMKEYTLIHDVPPKVALAVIYCIRSMCNNQRPKKDWSMIDRVNRVPSFNEWCLQNKFQNLQETLAISQSRDNQLHNHLHDPSEMARKDECDEYLKMVAEKAGEDYRKVLDMARNKVKAELAKQFIGQHDGQGPIIEDDYFNSSQGSPSAAATSLGYSSVAEACSGSNNVMAASVLQDQPLPGDDSVTSARNFPSNGSPLDEDFSFDSTIALSSASTGEDHIGRATATPDTSLTHASNSFLQDFDSSYFLQDFEEHGCQL